MADARDGALALLLLCGALLSSAPAGADANEAAEGALDKLRRGGEVSCQPVLPYFCENVHVKCVGQTPIPTFRFELRAAGRAGPLALVTAAEEFQASYRNAGIEWGSDGSYVLLLPPGTNGYLKLHADGKYVFRHYVQSRGVMSLGSCR